jgi:hypothetical protein
VTIQELIALFRQQVADEALPYLWSDDEVLQYVVDAQDVFVRKTGGLADATTAAICSVALVADEPFSDLSPYILRIRSGRLVTAGRNVRFGREADMGNIMVRDYGWTQGMTFDDDDTGEVTHGILGLGENKVRWVRVPVASDTCKLHVFRLPYPRIADQEDALEIGEQHHLHLVKWMKHLAYSKQDAETRDDKLALESRVAFEAYCDESRREKERNRYRTGQVQFGFP